MEINNVKLIYFSPTKTTKHVIEGIANGLQPVKITQLDMTLPQADQLESVGIQDDLVILGAPVYGGRIPQVAVNRLSKIRGKNTPAVVVVVYGNRDIDDALMELSDLAIKTGCRPVACGVFIGEHSFSSDTVPIARNRPDDEDRQLAGMFGKSIREKLLQISNIDDIMPLKLPGNFPYKKRGKHSWTPPGTRENLCTLSGRCKKVCPVGAITITNMVKTDVNACIYCCACVKECLTKARYITDTDVKKITLWLSKTFPQRKVPYWFI